jgi:hypothetical protein
MTFQPHWRHRYQLKQPNPIALQALAAISGTGILINYVEVAFDFIMGSQSDASRLQEFFEMSLVQRWHGRRKLNSYEGTAYFSATRNTGNSIKLYCDKPSRTTVYPFCTHLEWRAKSARIVRERLGIKGPIDLLSFDHRAFWRQEMALFQVDLVELGREIRKRSRNHRQTHAVFRMGRRGMVKVDLDRRAGELAVRAIRGSNSKGQPAWPKAGSAQEIKDNVRKLEARQGRKRQRQLNLKKVLTRLDATPLLL